MEENYIQTFLTVHVHLAVGCVAFLVAQVRLEHLHFGSK